MRSFYFVSLLLIASLLACENRTGDALPILGETTVDEKTGNVVYYQAPAFSFTDQLNQTISNADFDGKVYVVDFFFTSCPTICPKMTNHLKRVQDHFEDEKGVGIISYSIDPEHDTPERLSAYADHYGIDQAKWSLLTGADTEIFEIAKDYKVMAFDDGTQHQPSLIHDGTFVLVDDKRRIRGYYNGLDDTEVTRLISDIEWLLESI
ncbi:MAG: SCO family protein [Bacteroidota bacterium]